MTNLDVLIAEKVMGWTLEEIVHALMCYKAGMQCDKPMPYYSTKLEDAWQIAEKLDGDVILQKSGSSNEYYATAYHNGIRATSDWVKTAPLAICLAAIKAVTSDPNEYRD